MPKHPRQQPVLSSPIASDENVNKTGGRSRPSYAISTIGSRFGAEASIEERWSQQNLQFLRKIWGLNEEQYGELCKMRYKLADIDHWKNNPYEAARFVMGPQGYDKAEELFRGMIDWRIEHKIDTILETYKPPKALYDYIPSAILAGYDKDGDPIYLERGGAIDGHGLIARYGCEKLQQHVIWSRELASRGRWIEDYERKMGKPPTRLTIVYDLHGLNSRHLRSGVLPFLNECMKITQLRYNGLAKRMIIIRAPSLFNVVWNVCKYVFPKGAVKKMVFSGPHNYLEVLDKYIDRDVLPASIVPGGKGQVAIDMPPRLEGGLLPDNLPPAQEEQEIDPFNRKNGKFCMRSNSEITSTTAVMDDSERDFHSARSSMTSTSKIKCKRITGGWLMGGSKSPPSIQVLS